MDRGSVLSGAAFTAVLLSAVAFLMALVTVGFVTHSFITENMTDEMRADIQARWSLFSAAYHDEGPEPFIDLIESAALLDIQGQRTIGLFDVNGATIAGNLGTRPLATGWQQGPLDVAQDTGANDALGQGYLFRSGQIDGFTLVVGQRMDRLSLINRAMFRTLAFTGFIVVLTMLSAGFFLSRRSLFKLEHLEATLARVSDGDMAARVTISPGGDQFDRIAGRVNSHLDTLSRLMVTTRATAAAIAHDLKSPLARAYLGLGRALDRIDADQDPRTEIEDTQAELEHMTGIFDSILRLARIEAGADAAQFTSVDLGALIVDLVETYQLVAEDSGQSLRYEPIEGVDLAIWGDARMLQQMIVNLLQNAVTHGGPGNDIRLRLDRVADQVRLTLTDTGPGIPEAAREAVFEPFHRLDPSRNTPGSGLGLALVRAIAARHDAHITLSDAAPGLRVVVVFAPQP